MIAQTAPRTAAPQRSITARMADFITSHTASTGSVTRDDLRIDFTDAQIDQNIEAAKKIARNAGKVRQ